MGIADIVKNFDTLIEEGFRSLDKAEGSGLEKRSLDVMEPSFKDKKDKKYAKLASVLYHRFYSDKPEDNPEAVEEIKTFVKENKFYNFIKRKSWIVNNPKNLVEFAYLSFALWKSLKEYAAKDPECNSDIPITPKTTFSDLGMNYNDLTLLENIFDKFAGNSIEEKNIPSTFLSMRELLYAEKGNVSRLIGLYRKKKIDLIKYTPLFVRT